MKATERKFIRFTRSSIIVPPEIAQEAGLKDGDQWLGVTFHDVNGTGMLYGNNKTSLRGDYDLDAFLKHTSGSNYDLGSFKKHVQ